MESRKVSNVPLPEKIELLSSEEILGLLKEHKNQLQLYVSKFHPQEALKDQANKTRRQLQLLESKFQKLEDERTCLQGQLEECRIMELHYVKKWQDLRQKIMERYHDDALKQLLQKQMKEIEDRSTEMEKAFNKNGELDIFLNDYILMRTQYHLKREKLTTWNQQGNLKI